MKLPKAFRKDELSGLKSKLKEEEFNYEIEKAKNIIKSFFTSRLNKKNDEKYNYLKPNKGVLPNWAKALSIIVPSLAITALIAWLVSLRPETILQIRGPEAEFLINEEQGKVTALSAMLVINLCYYEAVSILLERRPYIPQNMISGSSK